MPVLVADDHPRLVAWAEGVIGAKFSEHARAIGLEGADGLRAVTVYDHFTECDCHMHIATRDTGRDINKALVLACFAYPFIQLRLRRVTGLVPASNAKALRFDLHLGFQVEGRMRETYPNDDTIVLGMLRRECRFIPARYRV